MSYICLCGFDGSNMTFIKKTGICTKKAKWFIFHGGTSLSLLLLICILLMLLKFFSVQHLVHEYPEVSFTPKLRNSVTGILEFLQNTRIQDFCRISGPCFVIAVINFEPGGTWRNLNIYFQEWQHICVFYVHLNASSARICLRLLLIHFITKPLHL